MKAENTSNHAYRKSENLSSWIKKYEEHCLKNEEIDDDIREYFEYSMEACSKERKDFHDNYLFNLDNNLNVLSSKKNYNYLDFFKSPDPYAPFDKDLFKRKNKIKN